MIEECVPFILTDGQNRIPLGLNVPRTKSVFQARLILSAGDCWDCVKL